MRRDQPRRITMLPGGGASGTVLLAIVVQKMRQPGVQNTAIGLVSRSAARSGAASTRQPDSRVLWKRSTFRRWAYHPGHGPALRSSPTG
jgi:hypothetical protein